MEIPFLDLSRKPLPDPQVCTEVFNRGWFILGPEVSEFESAFAGYCGTDYCVGVGNGTDALELALRGIGIGPGDEVVTVANAGMYSTVAIRAVGGIPVYVDVDPDTMLMSPPALAAALGPDTRAIVVTHLYGRMAPMAELLEIAERQGIPVLEDCAQAHGAVDQGRKAGAWGIAGCFSFYPTKNLAACGDAGAIVTSDERIASRARALRQYGWSSRFHASVPGGRNSRLDELQAAIVRSRLPYLDSGNQRRRAIANRYTETFASYPVLRVPPPAGEDHVAHLYVIRCARRDELKNWLVSCGIGVGVYYPVPDYNQPSQAGLPFRGGPLENTESCTREILSLPCYPELKDCEVEFVARSVQEWLE
jgi:aminotransferase EvaB